MDLLQDLVIFKIPLIHNAIKVRTESSARKLVAFNKRFGLQTQNLWTNWKTSNPTTEIKDRHGSKIPFVWVWQSFSGTHKLAKISVLFGFHQTIKGVLAFVQIRCVHNLEMLGRRDTATLKGPLQGTNHMCYHLELAAWSNTSDQEVHGGRNELSTFSCYQDHQLEGVEPDPTKWAYKNKQLWKHKYLKSIRSRGMVPCLPESLWPGKPHEWVSQTQCQGPAHGKVKGIRYRYR